MSHASRETVGPRRPATVPLVAFVVLFAFGTAGRAAVRSLPSPTLVSPGHSEAVPSVQSGCPTFSWSLVPGASSYELMVFRLEAGESGRMEPESGASLSASVPGGATSYSPSLSDCLEPGGAFGWIVRAITDDRAGEWSLPSFFRVPERLSRDEVTAALEVLRAYVERGGSLAALASAAPEDAAQETAAPAPVSHAPVPRPTADGAQAMPRALATPGATAFRASVPDTTGVVFGAHGVSHSAGAGSAGVVGQSTAASGEVAGVHAEVASPDGAAGVFDNTAGGTLLSARVAGVERFNVAGDGTVTAQAFAGDGSQLTSLPAGTADDLDCVGCVDTGDLADGSVSSAKIAVGAVGSSQIADGSVGTTDLAFDPATQAELDAHKTSGDHDGRYVNLAGDTMTGVLALPADGLVAGTDQLVLAGGRVGIGTATPSQRLEVVAPPGDGTVIARFAAAPSTGNGPGQWIMVDKTGGFDHNVETGGIRFGNDNHRGVELVGVYQGNAGYDLRMKTHDGTAIAPRVTVRGDGRVGLGTMAPDTRLHVEGTVKIADGTEGAGRVLTSDATGQGSWQPPAAASDLDCVGCVDTGDLADASVTGAKITNAAVGSSQIADGSVGTADLAFDPATQAELDAHKISGDHDGRYPTAVNTPAGSGLEGGASSGDLSLSLLTSCADGQVLKRIGGSWACAEDAAATGERITILEDHFGRSSLSAGTWTIATSGGGTVTPNSAEDQVDMGTGGGGCDSATLQGNRQFSIGIGALLFRARLAAYHDSAVYGDGQPRGLANGTDRNNAIEFVSISQPSTIQARTVAGGVATTTSFTIPYSFYDLVTYQIVATTAEVKFYANGELVATHTTNIPTTPLNVLFNTTDSCAGTVPIVIDWVAFERRE